MRDSMVPRFVPSSFDDAQLLVNALETVVNRLSLRQQAGRTVKQPDDERLALFQRKENLMRDTIDCTCRPSLAKSVSSASSC